MTIDRGAGGAYRPGYEIVAERLLAYITEMGLHPGDRLPIGPALCEELTVGRTVLNEAIRMLTATGRLRARRGSGVYVAEEAPPLVQTAIPLSMPADPEHMVELYEFRRVQETHAVRLASERITLREMRTLEQAVACYKHSVEVGDQRVSGEHDEAFHRGIAEASKNRFLFETVTAIYHLQEWVNRLMAATDHAKLIVAAEQHAAILAAIKEGQPDAAAAAMHAHIDMSLADYQHQARALLVGQTTRT